MSNNPYAETFVNEAQELLLQVEDTLLSLEEKPDDLETINRLFRAIHTIKGSGSMFGFDEVSEFTHHFETVLDLARSSKISLEGNFTDIALNAKDHIQHMLDMKAQNKAVNEKKTHELVQKFIDYLPSEEDETDESQNLISPEKGEESETEKFVYRIFLKPIESIFHSGMDPASLLHDLQELGECKISCKTDEIPEWDDINPEFCYLSWEIILLSKVDENAIRDVFIFVEDDAKIEIEKIYQKAPEKPKEEEKAPEAKVETTEDISFQSTPQKSNSIRVQAEKLDQLMNLVGEMVIAQSRMSQISRNSSDTKLAQTVEDMDRLTSSMRDAVLNVRMMPIGSTFSRFQRLVRDLAKKFGKEIILKTEGAETELDKNVLDQLNDPLVHMIRNCVDHALEEPNAREAIGKSREGQILLKAETKGANVVISVTDDGKGLNTERIREKALTKGLINESEELSEKEIHSLIFKPGFSTAEKVTDVSGRGVGMDVVRKEIEALRGRIEVESREGEGTTIHLTLPLTLAIIDGLLVELHNENYVIPVSQVEECLELSRDDYALSDGRNVIRHRGELLACIDLRELFFIESEKPERQNAVLVHVGNTRIGIIVDKVLGDYQTVIKSLGKVYQNARMFLGSTIMGNGSVALILDMHNLIRLAEEEEELNTLEGK